MLVYPPPSTRRFLITFAYDVLLRGALNELLRCRPERVNDFGRTGRRCYGRISPEASRQLEGCRLGGGCESEHTDGLEQRMGYLRQRVSRN